MISTWLSDKSKRVLGACCATKNQLLSRPNHKLFNRLPDREQDLAICPGQRGTWTKLQKFKVSLQRKIVDAILNASDQHFHTKLNGVFSFSISCFILDMLRFFETCKLGVSDVIYSRIINYIYQMVNISVNSRQKCFKLCITIAIW